MTKHHRVGARFFATFYPRYSFDYVDKEPCRAALSDSDIRGFIYGIPTMGYAFWTAYVGEPLSCATMKASTVNDWGDGTGWTAGTAGHTYDEPGLYWAQISSGSGQPCTAVRPVRVIYRAMPETLLSPFDVKYPIAMTGGVDGSIQSTVSFQFSLRIDGRTNLSLIGQVYDRTGVAVWMEEALDNAENWSSPSLVTGGWVSDMSEAVTSAYTEFTFTAIGFTNWLNMSRCWMREQQYTSPKMIALMMAANAKAAQDALLILTTDYLHQGYIPNHWLQADTVVVAMHIFQHVRTKAENSPVMKWPQDAYGYGMLSQFISVVVDADFNEATGLPGSEFQDFNISPGNVMSNIRSLVTNEAWRVYERADTFLRFERLPQYRTSQTTPILTLDDLAEAGDGLLIEGSEEIAVREIIIERPVTMLPIPTDLVPPEVPVYDPIAKRDGYDPDDCNSGSISPPDTEETAMLAELADLNKKLLEESAAAGNTADNPMANFDPDQYLYKWPTDVTGRVGQTIEMKGYYSKSLPAIAEGKYKEVRCRWRVTVSLLHEKQGDLGDIVKLTHAGSVPYAHNWYRKSFEVQELQMELRPGGALVRQLVLGEIDPDEQDGGNGGGGNPL